MYLAGWTPQALRSGWGSITLWGSPGKWAKQMFVLSWGSPGWGVKAWHCPGFGQDRVNFHRTPARGTAGGMGADPTRPNRARCSIPCDVTRGSDGGAVRQSLSHGFPRGERCGSHCHTGCRGGSGAAVTVTRGADGGSGAAVTRSWLGSAGPGPESRSVMRVCVLFSPYLYRCCCCSLCLLFC